MVVLPDDSGPKISMTRPRGNPPTPSAASKEMAPVGITAIGTMASFDPNRMIEPLPNCFSICENARSIALLRSSAIMPAPEFGWVMRTLVAYTHGLAGRKCCKSRDFGQYSIERKKSEDPLRGSPLLEPTSARLG